jgi:hypothetical protein
MVCGCLVWGHIDLPVCDGCEAADAYRAWQVVL